MINIMSGGRLNLPFDIIIADSPPPARETTHILSLSCQSQILLAKWNNPQQIKLDILPGITPSYLFIFYFTLFILYFDFIYFYFSLLKIGHFPICSVR